MKSAAAPSSRLPEAPAAALRWQVPLALAAVYLIWGSTYLGMRVALGSFPPFWTGALRFLAAGGGMLCVLRLQGAPWPSARQWRHSALMGALLLVGGNGGVIFAQQWVASGLAAVMVASTPLYAALFAGLFGRWPRPHEWVGLALGLGGIVLLNLSGDLRAHPLGALLLLLAPASWAFGSVLRPRLDQPAGMMAAAAQMLAGGLLFVPLALLHGAPLPARPSLPALLALGYLALFGSLAFAAYDFLLRHVRPTLATSYAYVNPVVALVLGALLAGERVGPSALAGAALVVAAVALIALWRRPEPPQAPSTRSG